MYTDQLLTVFQQPIPKHTVFAIVRCKLNKRIDVEDVKKMAEEHKIYVNGCPVSPKGVFTKIFEKDKLEIRA